MIFTLAAFDGRFSGIAPRSGLRSCVLFVRKWILLAAAMAWAGSAPPLRADVLLTDSFDYTNGPLVTVSGGLWAHHSGTVTGEVQVISGRAVLSQTNSEDVNALLAGQPYRSTNTARLYAGFTLNLSSLPTGSGAYFAHFKDSSATGFRDKLFVTTNSAAPGAYRVGVACASNAPSVTLATDLALNADYRLVTRYAPSNASCTLWLDPAAETDPGATASDTASTLDIAAFALRESLSSGSGMGTMSIDTLVVGTSFSDVVSNSAVPPGIAAEPPDQTVTEGSNVTFTVVATGSGLRYQWQFYGTNLGGATGSSLLLPAVTTNQAGPYSVTITNTAGSTNSRTALLTVNPAVAPPSITLQPQSQVVTEGSNATFTVEAAGTPPLGYQWKFYGTNLPGATGSSLNLIEVTTNQAGPYAVTVTNAGGATNSDTVTLTVNPRIVRLPALTVLTYNVAGNGATNWSTNSLQVQAIGRQVQNLQPDIITFNEIPSSYMWGPIRRHAANRRHRSSNIGRRGPPRAGCRTWRHRCSTILRSASRHLPCSRWPPKWCCRSCCKVSGRPTPAGWSRSG